MTEAVNGLAWCLSTSAFPVSMDDFARIAPMREVWFRPTGHEAEPTPWRIYQQAAAVARMTNLPDRYEELHKLAEPLGN